MSNRYPRHLMPGLIAGVALGLAACGSVGDGNGLKSIRVVPQDGVDGDTVVKTYLCLSERLQLIGEFDDGQLGDFSSRALWASSSPAIVEVSNGDIEIPSLPDTFFSSGTLIPLSEGSATLTASYLGLEAAIEVQVGAPSSLTITPVDARVATSTSRAIELTAVLDGAVEDVTGFATYEIEGQDLDDNDDGIEDDDADQEIALINAASGVLLGQNIGGPVTVVATFPICDQTLSAQITVQDPQALILSHQDGFDGELIADTSEAFSLFADFGNGPEQDLTAQLTFDASNTEIAQFSAIPGIRNILLAGATAGAVETSATLSYGDDPDTEEEDPTFTLTSNVLPVTIVAATLDSVSIRPLDATVAALGTIDFTATGTYDGGTRTQDLTRHVGWSSSDTAVVGIGTGVSPFAGQAASLQREAAVVTIEATHSAATVTPTASTTLTVVPEN